MGLARNYGVHVDLETFEEIERAHVLAVSNGRKYEVVNVSLDGNKSGRSKTRLYFYAQGSEVDEILKWIQTGEGEQPSKDLQGPLSKH
jgi:hypothetical protein